MIKKRKQLQAELKKCLMNGALHVGSMCETHANIASIIDGGGDHASQNSTLFGRQQNCEKPSGFEVKALLETFTVGATLSAFLKSDDFQ